MDLADLVCLASVIVQIWVGEHCTNTMSGFNSILSFVQKAHKWRERFFITEG